MFIYCKTNEPAMEVGKMICRANFIDNMGKSWNIEDEGEYYTIKINSNSMCVAVIYSLGNSVVGIEVDENCASKMIEPLIEKYGFEKVKWFVAK